MKKSIKTIFTYGVFCLLVIGSIVFTMSRISQRKITPILSSISQNKFTLKEISEYNDSGKHQQILLAFEGSVYDVTAGKEFYGSEGPYHYLAGTDATAMLHIAGGAIVKRKYPIIGMLSL